VQNQPPALEKKSGQEGKEAKKPTKCGPDTKGNPAEPTVETKEVVKKT